MRFTDRTVKNRRPQGQEDIYSEKGGKRNDRQVNISNLFLRHYNNIKRGERLSVGELQEEDIPLQLKKTRDMLLPLSIFEWCYPS